MGRGFVLVVVGTVDFRAPRKKMRPDPFLAVAEFVYFINNGLEVTLDFVMAGRGMRRGFVLVVVGTVDFRAPSKKMRPNPFLATAELVYFINNGLEITLFVGMTG